MKHTKHKRLVSCILCCGLLAAAALTTIGCTDTIPEPPAGSTHDTAVETAAVIGEGDTVFTFTVTDEDKNVTAFEIHTSKTVVGEALAEVGLIAGDPGPYGLYVKTVNGITVDYDKDHAYWAFYENGGYAAKGVDKTEIREGVTYGFKVEKG